MKGDLCDPDGHFHLNIRWFPTMLTKNKVVLVAFLPNSLWSGGGGFRMSHPKTSLWYEDSFELKATQTRRLKTNMSLLPPPPPL